MTPFLKLFGSILSQLEANLDKKFSNFQNEMMAVTKAKDDEIARLETQVKLQKSHIAQLEARCEDQSQYTRRESLVFSGQKIPAHATEEDCCKIICDLISTEIDPNTQLTPSDFSIAHRLGPKPTSGNDRRSIIARFCRRKLKYDVLNKAKRSKPQGLYVSESLTPMKQKIVRIIRNAKRSHPDIISGYSTSDGTIYLWVKPPNPNAAGARNSRMTIDTLEKIDKFCRDNFQVAASHFDRLPSTPNRN